MSQYRFEVHWPSGRKNSSGAVSKAAYINREKYHDERLGKSTQDYSKNHEEELLWADVFVDPKANAPEWVKDPEQLWNKAVAAEKRQDALECQDAIGNLPHELTVEQNKLWVTDFIRENLTRGTGRVVNVAFHAPSEKSDDRNFHAHIMWTLRAVGPEGFDKKKLPAIDKVKLEKMRERWAQLGARALERAAHEKEKTPAERDNLLLEAARFRAGYLTLEKQRDDALRRGDLPWAKELDREPTLHEGPNVRAMERDGEKTRKGEQNREIREANRQRATGREDHNIGEIRVAYRDARHATDFRMRLGREGIELAQITKQEALESRLDNRAARDAGKYSPVYKEAEIVALAENGQVYRLTERTTGDKPWLIKAFMEKLEGPPLPTLEETRKLQEQRAVDRHNLAKDGMDVPLERRDDARRIWDTYNSTKDPEAFRQNIEFMGFHLGRVTAEDASASTAHNLNAKMNGRVYPIQKEGEYVVITERGHIYHLNERSVGHNAKTVQAALRPLDARAWPSVREVTGRLEAERFKGKDYRPTGWLGREKVGDNSRPLGTTRRVARSADSIFNIAAKGVEMLAGKVISPEQRRMDAEQALRESQERDERAARRRDGGDRER